ncbi:hypothetical protein H4582DRAFT_621334 [Lactarius indigo]|nr:hypothetical protein H4582DRAFT_621334 [Lactarius indigo]
MVTATGTATRGASVTARTLCLFLFCSRDDVWAACLKRTRAGSERRLDGSPPDIFRCLSLRNPEEGHTSVKSKHPFYAIWHHDSGASLIYCN